MACCRPCNVIKGRRLFGSFAEAKAYVLARRDVLRKAWKSLAKPTPAARTPKNRLKLATAPARDSDESEISRPAISEEDDFLVELGGEG